MHTVVRPDRGWGAIPTNDGLTVLILGWWPYAEAAAYRADVEGNHLATLALAPEFAERVRSATRQERFKSAAVANFFRKPFGPGWALVGDAGYTKDPITAQGISDAFRDAQLCCAALDQTFAGQRPFARAMAVYQRKRDTQALPVYELTTQFAALEPPPEQIQRLLAAVASNPLQGDCGIYNVTTLEHARRRGLGTALTALQVHDALARGCATVSLQSTEMAEHIYAAVGFRDLGRILEYVR